MLIYALLQFSMFKCIHGTIPVPVLKIICDAAEVNGLLHTGFYPDPVGSKPFDRIRIRFKDQI
jgi:hypothetical protein